MSACIGHAFRFSAPKPANPHHSSIEVKGEAAMARVKRAVHSKKRRRVILKRARGYYGNKSRTFRAANEQVMH